MKKSILLFAAIFASLQLFAADFCTLRTVAVQNGDDIELTVIPEIDWSQSDSPNLDALVAVYFFDEWMEPLESPDNFYRAVNGQVAANTKVYLSDGTSGEPLLLVIPVAQLHLKEGQKTFCYTVELFADENDGFRSLAVTAPSLFELPIDEVAVPEICPPVEDIAAPVEVIETELASKDASAADIADNHPKMDKKAKKEATEKAVSNTFNNTYRYGWDEDLYEELQFHANGTVELVRVFKIWDKSIVRKGNYVVYVTEGSPNQRIVIDWHKGASETFTRSGSSKNHSLLKDGKEWKAVK